MTDGSARRPDEPVVHILVLNWNGWRDTIECLDSLGRLAYRRHRVTVVDNGSSDGSVEHILEAHPGISLLQMGANLGFAGGNNLGIQRALRDGAEYVWLLNNDAVVAPSALRAMVDMMRGAADIGVVGPVIREAAPPHEVQVWGGGTVNRFLWTTRSITRPDAGALSYIAGTGMLVRRDVFEDIGLLDPDYFFYLEDVDLCLRAAARGWRLAVADEAVIWHKGGATVNDGRAERSDRADRHHARSSGIFLGRHAGPWVVAVAPVRLAAMILRRLGRGQASRVPVLTRLFLSGLRVGVRRRRSTHDRFGRRGRVWMPGDVPVEGMRAEGHHRIPKVLQVSLGESGGGRTHLRLLAESLGDRVLLAELVLPPSSPPWTPGAWISSARAVRHAIRHDRPIVHAHGVRAAAAVALAAPSRRTPLVITVHGLHSLRRRNDAWTRFWNRRVLRRARVVLVLSDSDVELIQRRRLARPGAVRPLHPAFCVPTLPPRAAARSALGIDDDRVVALWLGRLSDEKNPLAFVEAISRTTDARVTGLICGDGPLMPKVREAVTELRLDHRVRVLGWLNDPSPALAAADLFISTSRWEGSNAPIAVLEAAAARLPIVLSDVPGNRAVPRSGIPAELVPGDDLAAIASAIDRLAGDADRRHANGERAARIARSRFTPEALAEDVLASYRSVLRRR